MCFIVFIFYLFFSLVHSDIVIDVFFLGLVQGYCQCTMVPFSPFPFMFLFVFVFYHVTVWMESNKLNWTDFCPLYSLGGSTILGRGLSEISDTVYGASMRVIIVAGRSPAWRPVVSWTGRAWRQGERCHSTWRRRLAFCWRRRPAAGQHRRRTASRSASVLGEPFQQSPARTQRPPARYSLQRHKQHINRARRVLRCNRDLLQSAMKQTQSDEIRFNEMRPSDHFSVL